MSIGVALGEIVTFECQVQANPSTVHFEWTTNRTGVPRVPLTYTSSGQSSVAKFVATSEEDYGLVQCFSQNGIGRQRNACSFQVIKAGTCPIYFFAACAIIA